MLKPVKKVFFSIVDFANVGPFGARWSVTLLQNAIMSSQLLRTILSLCRLCLCTPGVEICKKNITHSEPFFLVYRSLSKHFISTNLKYQQEENSKISCFLEWWLLWHPSCSCRDQCLLIMSSSPTELRHLLHNVFMQNPLMQLLQYSCDWKVLTAVIF